MTVQPGPESPAYLIMGATGGIGSTLCRRLHARGARLMLCAREGEKLAALAEEVGGDYVSVDGASIPDVERVAAAAKQQFGRLDGAVNAIGSLLLKPAHLTTEEEWHATLAANLTSAFALVRAATKAGLERNGGIVLVTSAAARLGMVNHEAIAAAKAGVTGLGLSAAATYAPRGIRVNVVSPGLTETPMTEKLCANELSRKQSEQMHPLGRLGQAGDVASAIDWLLHPEQAWVTGQVLGVDGGLGSVLPRQKVTR